MRRLLILATVLFGCGVATSIFLAWLSASMQRPSLGDNRFFREKESDRDSLNGWYVVEIRDRAMTMRYFWPESSFAPEVNADYDPPAYSAAHKPAPTTRLEHKGWEAPYVFGVEKEHGWPMRCLRTSWRAADNRAALPREPLESGVLIKPVRWGLMPTFLLGQPSLTYVEAERRYAIPLRPMYLGLLANSALFSLVWAVPILLLPVPRLLMKLRRKRTRERCCNCGYDLSATRGSLCSECGWERGRRKPLIGKWSMRLGLFLFALTWVGTIGFGYWRSHVLPVLPKIHLAAANGDLDMLRSELANGVDPDLLSARQVPTYDYSMSDAPPLMWAIARGQIEAAELLLRAGANPDKSTHQRGPSLRQEIAWLGKSGLLEAIEARIDAEANNQ